MIHRERGAPGERGVDRAAGFGPLADLGAEHLAFGDAFPRFGAHLLVRFVGPSGVEVVRAGEHVVSDARQSEDVRVRADACVEGLFGRGIADGAEADTRKCFAEAGGPRQAEIGNLEDLRFAEPAAQDVAGRQIAVNDAYAVNRRDAARETTERVRRSQRIEGVAGFVDGVGDAVFEGRAFDAAVHVLDRDPWRRRQTEVRRAAGVDEAHDERAWRYALVQAAEGYGLFLCHELGRNIRRPKRATYDLDDHR